MAKPRSAVVLGDLGEHLHQAGAHGEDGFDMEIQRATFVKKDGEHRLQIVFRGLVTDENRDLGQGIEDKGDIGLIPVNRLPHEQIDQVAQQPLVFIGQFSERRLAAAAKEPLPFDAAVNLPERNPSAGNLVMRLVGDIGE